jgi:electron transport complex protein RnfD
VITEIIFQRLRGKKITISDGSIVVTGLLLAFILPPSLPWGVALLGAVVSVGLGKQIFGGLGLNIFNPALVGRAFLMAAFPTLLTHWVEPYTLDAVSKATPLGLMKFQGIATPLVDLFLGSTSGSLGETSSLAIILGGGYLLIKRHIDWRTPLSIMLTVVITAGVFWLLKPTQYPSPLFCLFAGGLMLGAFFMATDPVASPMTKMGHWVFGIGIGILVVVIRLFGGLPEGVMYAILIMEATIPLINRLTRPRVFGRQK